MDRYTVEYLPVALDDISSILTYVMQSSQNLTTAERYIDRLFERCERIGDAPFGGVARPDLAPDLRMVVFERSIVILYQVQGNIVRITNILSGSRDYAALWQGDR